MLPDLSIESFRLELTSMDAVADEVVDGGGAETRSQTRSWCSSGRGCINRLNWHSIKHLTGKNRRWRQRREGIEQRGRGQGGRSREGEVGNGGGGELDGVPAGVEDGGVVGDEDVDAVDVAAAGGDAVGDPGR